MKTSNVLLAVLLAVPVAACAQDGATKSDVASESPTIAKASCASPKGMWKNQMGSRLEIKSVAANGAVTGQYQTKTGATGWYPLSGWVNSAAGGNSNKKVISFSTHWGTIGSVTSWSGICDSANSQLKTMWFLARSSADYDWAHILSGSDSFTPE